MTHINDANTYQEQSRRTWTTEAHDKLVHSGRLGGEIDRAAFVANQLDSFKRALFYGDDSQPTGTGPGMALTEEQFEFLHAALGLATEAGEVLEQVMHMLTGTPVDEVNVSEEGGDLLYYLARLADVCDTTLLDMMRQNDAKLRERFPEKFDADQALNRDLDAERETMEAHSSKSGRRNEAGGRLTPQDVDPVEWQ